MGVTQCTRSFWKGWWDPCLGDHEQVRPNSQLGVHTGRQCPPTGWCGPQAYRAARVSSLHLASGCCPGLPGGSLPESPSRLQSDLPRAPQLPLPLPFQDTAQQALVWLALGDLTSAQCGAEATLHWSQERQPVPRPRPACRDRPGSFGWWGGGAGPGHLISSQM